MIILRQNNFSKDGEKKMRWIDRTQINEYKRNKKLLDAAKKRYDENPETRKEGDKEDLKERIKQGTLIPVSIAAPIMGAGYYADSRIREKMDRRDSAVKAGAEAIKFATPLLAGAGVGAGIKSIQNKRKNKRFEEGNLSDRDRKNIDKIKVAEGKMSNRDFKDKWGK